MKSTQNLFTLIRAQKLKCADLCLVKPGQESVCVNLAFWCKANKIAALVMDGALPDNDTFLLQTAERGGERLFGIAETSVETALGAVFMLADFIKYKQRGILNFVMGSPFIINSVHLKIAAVIAVNITA